MARFNSFFGVMPNRRGDNFEPDPTQEGVPEAPPLPPDSGSPSTGQPGTAPGPPPLNTPSVPTPPAPTPPSMPGEDPGGFDPASVPPPTEPGPEEPSAPPAPPMPPGIDGTFTMPGAPASSIAPFRTPNFLQSRFIGGGGTFGPGAPLAGVGAGPTSGSTPTGMSDEEIARRLLGRNRGGSPGPI